MSNSKKILIIGPSWVGDMVMAEALFSFLKKRNQNVIIDVLANEKMHPLLARMKNVSAFIALPFAHRELNLLQRFVLGKSLFERQYDQAIVLPNSFKSALIPFCAKIPKRTGFRGEMRYGLLNDMRVLDRVKTPLMVERFLTLGLENGENLPQNLPRPSLTVNASKVRELFARLKILPNKKPILVLCPGAEYGSAKRWPKEYFAQLASIFAKENWQIWILGGVYDFDSAEYIQKNSALNCCNFVGKTDLGDASCLISLADMVVANDSGLMHIASALDRKIIAIYGSSSPKFTPPLSAKARILELSLPCRPCFKRECPFKTLACLWNITPEMVAKEIRDMV